MKLLIVESPGKVKKIQGFLGPEWKVAASVGHVRDMPVKRMGVAAPDFTPEYEATERGADVLKRLAALVKTADAVYLATDPDREGEAIAWHLAEALKLKNPRRVTYTEITESAVKAAVNGPRGIDMALVKAQEARRVLDRFCGYLASGPVSRVAGQKMSAGRVQSPATRLIVERERAIQAFVSTTHYGAELAFAGVDNITDGWKAQWLVKEWLPGGEEFQRDKALADKMAALRVLDVLDCKEGESRSAPPPPFTTSSLQQAANTALKYSAKKTMELAQALYESGAITYHRTDSPNLSTEAVEAIRAYCSEQGWPVPATLRTWKAKGNAQEAHEAIRCTHIEMESAGETEEQKALYALIRLRALASQMEDAVYSVIALRLGADLDGKQAVFEARGRKLTAQGWKVLAADQEEDNEDAAKEGNNPVPAMKAGSKATALSGRLLTKKTTPPARYTEASLVAELEKRGIGRPSTYAAILETIKTREYVKIEKNRFVPTPLGVLLMDSLQGNFSFCEYDFTEKLEQALDDIAEGKAGYNAVLAPAYQTLMDEVQAFQRATGKICPTCGKAMIRRVGKGKNGKPYDFWGCSGYPDCTEKL
jgi:DNA topoisomerase-1